MSEPRRDPRWALRPHVRRVVAWLRALPEAELLLLLGVVAAVVAFGAALGFAKLTESVWRGHGGTTWDAHVHHWLVQHRTPWLSDVFRALTRLGNPGVIVVVTVVAVVVLLVVHRPRLAAFMVASTCGAALLVLSVKTLVGRPRPASIDRLVTVSGPAFPSGHAAQSIACYGAVAVVVVWLVRSPLLRAVVAVGAVALGLLVGASRAYLGVHWPSDVVAGWFLAIAWLSGLVVAFVADDLIRRRRAGPGSAHLG
jgi:undecaprenyl-diphosphatase